jgi:hypothetical protein
MHTTAATAAVSAPTNISASDFISCRPGCFPISYFAGLDSAIKNSMSVVLD